MNAFLYEILVALILCWIGYTVLRSRIFPYLDRIVDEQSARRTMLGSTHCARQQESEQLDGAQQKVRRYYDEQKQRIDQWSAVCSQKMVRSAREASDRNRMLHDQWYARYSEMATQREQRELLESALVAARQKLIDRYQDSAHQEAYLCKVLPHDDNQ